MHARIVVFFYMVINISLRVKIVLIMYLIENKEVTLLCKLNR